MNIREELMQARTYRSHPECITLIVSGRAAWQQVVAFLRPLRAPSLPFVQPVMVLTNESPPAYLADLYAEVAFVVGPVVRVDNLLRAGVLESCCVVILAGEARPGLS